MKIKCTKYLVLVLVLVLIFSCKKDPLKGLPTVTISAVKDFTLNSATCVGEITSDGGVAVTARGLCWSIEQNPTTASEKSNDGSGIGSFVRVIIDLNPGTTYNLRAYAINNEGTGYSSQTTFTTLASTPVLTTNIISEVTSTSVTSGGNITSDGGTPVTSRGICWSYRQNPTISDNKTSDGTGLGSFTNSISGLSPGMTYYFRAYATNNIGTAYGNQVSITINAILPVLNTTDVSLITVKSATSGGSVSNNGGAMITACGVCWNTSKNPTIADNKTSNNLTGITGTGYFTSNITGLNSNTIYYLRAYATNSAGTTYGGEVTFKTLESGIGTVTDIDGNIYHTIAIGTQMWMVENLKTTKLNDGTSIPNVTEDPIRRTLLTPCYCWYKNDINYKNTYGAFYNWYTVNTGKLAPTGWHIPTDAEWTTLTTFLGGSSIAGGKLKEPGTTHWTNPNNGATNESGFTAIAARLGSISNYEATWWSATENSAEGAYSRGLYSNQIYIERTGYVKNASLTVRCVKD